MPATLLDGVAIHAAPRSAHWLLDRHAPSRARSAGFKLRGRFISRGYAAKAGSELSMMLFFLGLLFRLEALTARQRAMAICQRPERLICRDRIDDLEDVPLAFALTRRFGLHQEDRVHLAPIHAHAAFAE